MLNLSKKQMDNVIMHHRWLVIKTAMKYKSFGLPLDDLISEGSIGLIKAVHKFDPAKNCSLKTYSSFWIKSQIFQYIISNWSLVKIGTTKASRNQFFKDASSFFKDSSLNKTDESGREFVDLVKDYDINSEEMLMAAEDFLMLKGSIDKVKTEVDDRSIEIFKSRRLAKEPLTLDALSKKHHISKERVRQIEMDVFEKIKSSVLEKS